MLKRLAIVASLAWSLPLLLWLVYGGVNEGGRQVIAAAIVAPFVVYYVLMFIVRYIVTGSARRPVWRRTVITARPYRSR